MTTPSNQWAAGLRDIAGRLEQVVVSLDRIGSAAVSDETERALMLRDFIVEWRIFESLAAARQAAFDLLEEATSPADRDDDVDQLDQLGIKRWPLWRQD